MKPMDRAFVFSTTFAMAALASPTAYAGTIHVPADVPTIQDAIDSAAPGDVVLVAPGTYFENIDFKGKAIEVRSSDGPFVTTIDGQSIDSVVKFLGGEPPSALLDGFSIVNGYGYIGYCNCTSVGGGIVISESFPDARSSNPTIRRCIIRDNVAIQGGGIYSNNCSPTIADCVIHDNEASSDSGGIYIAAGSYDGLKGVIVNCTVVHNYAARNGNPSGVGGIVNFTGSAVAILNTVVRENVAGMVNPVPSEMVTSHSTLVMYCNVKGGWSGTGNFDADPAFVDEPAGNFHLMASSPCVDAGDASAFNLQPFDLDGDARLIGAGVDVGADERTLAPGVVRVAPGRARYDSTPSVTISGSSFTIAGPPTVRVGSLAASNVVVLDDSTLTCDLPSAEPGPVEVGVTNAHGEGVLPNGFTFTPALLLSGDPSLGGTITLDYLLEPLNSIYAIAGFPPAVAYKTKPFDGTLCIDPHYQFIWVPLWPFDRFTIDIDIPDDPALSGTSYLAQALIGPKLGGKNKDGAWTNCVELTIQ